MGKSKGKKGEKSKKDSAIFKVAGVRKAKTKTVKTNLKKLNVKTKSKTDEANQKFEEMRQAVVESTKESKPKLIQKKSLPEKKASPDMDVTLEEFAKL